MQQAETPLSCRRQVYGRPIFQHKGRAGALLSLFPGMLQDSAPLDRSAGCPHATTPRPPPPPVLEGRLPGISLETPPASARGQGHPPPLSSRALPRQTGLPLKILQGPQSRSRRWGFGGEAQRAPGTGGLAGFPSPDSTYLLHRVGYSIPRLPPLSPAPVLGACWGAPTRSRPTPRAGSHGPGPPRHASRDPSPCTAPGSALSPPPRPAPTRRAGRERRQ